MAKQQETEAQAINIEARAYPLSEPKAGGTVAFASVTINDMIAIHGIRVIDSEKGRFAAMPSMKDKDGEYRDIAHPVTGDLRKQLNAAVLAAYDEALEKGPQEKASVRDQIKDGAKAPKEKPAPDKEKAAKKSRPER